MIKSRKELQKELLLKNDNDNNIDDDAVDAHRRRAQKKMQQARDKLMQQMAITNEDDSDEEEDDDDERKEYDMSEEEEEDGDVMMDEDDDDDDEDDEDDHQQQQQQQQQQHSDNKDDDLEYDIFNLMASDTHPLDLKQLRGENGDRYLMELAQQNTQFLVNKLFTLPTTQSEEGLFAKLPKQSTQMPREKPIPKPKLLTKWEQFRREKGLQVRKKEKLAYDETTDEFRPTFGYQRGKKGIDKDWIVPAKGDGSKELGSDPFLEARQKKTKALKLQAKNERGNKRRQENFENNIPGALFMSNAPSKNLGAKTLKNSAKGAVEKGFDFAKFSTASMGKFDPKIKGESKKSLKDAKYSRKQKTTFVGNQVSKGEKDSQKQVLNRVLKVAGQRKVALNEKANVVFQTHSEADKRKQNKVHLIGTNTGKRNFGSSGGGISVGGDMGGSRGGSRGGRGGGRGGGASRGGIHKKRRGGKK